MKILLVGAGGVGDAFAKIVARRSFYELVVVSDYDIGRAERTVAAIQARHGAWLRKLTHPTRMPWPGWRASTAPPI
jgi:saccharopine dehydrogenase-like NADP-dependent oxidoreductase